MKSIVSRGSLKQIILSRDARRFAQRRSWHVISVHLCSLHCACVQERRVSKQSHMTLSVCDDFNSAQSRRVRERPDVDEPPKHIKMFSFHDVYMIIRVTLAGILAERRGGFRRLEWAEQWRPSVKGYRLSPPPPKKKWIFAWNGVFWWILSGIFLKIRGTICISVPHSKFWGLFPASPRSPHDLRSCVWQIVIIVIVISFVNVVVLLPTTLVAQVEQSVRCASVYVLTTTVELNDLWPTDRWYIRLFIMTLSRSYSKLKVVDQSSRSQNENVAEVGGVAFSDGFLVTFRVRHSRSEMYIGHGRLCVFVSVCLSVHHRIPTLLYGPGYNLGNARMCPLVVQYWICNRCTSFIAMTT